MNERVKLQNNQTQKKIVIMFVISFHFRVYFFSNHIIKPSHSFYLCLGGVSAIVQL